MPTRFLLLLMIASSCGDRTGDECPDGTSSSVVELGQIRIRECKRPDGTQHGPVIEIDGQKRQRRIGQWLNGKKVGVWRHFVNDKVFSDATYVDGDLRTVVTYQEDGRPLTRAEYRDGVAHGKHTRWSETGLAIEREFTAGRRSGTWRRHGTPPEIKVYDQRGVLQSVDGKTLPAPPATISLPDGATLERDHCGLAAIDSYGAAACHDLFEAFQVCALDSDPAQLTACHERAFKEHRRPARP